MKPDSDAPKARVRWADIHAYAQQIPEYEIVRAIQADAKTQTIDVGEDASQQRLRGRPLAHFGPLKIGLGLEGGWTISVLTRSPGCVRCVLSANDDIVILAVSGPQEAAQPGPFDASPFTVSYEHTQLDFDVFSGAMKAVCDLLVASAAGAGEGVWQQWLDEAAGSEVKVHTQRFDDSQAIEIRADKKLYLRVTDSCQERCLFCFFYDTHAVDNLVRHHSLEEVIDRVDPAGIRQVVLSGGEPSLHPKLPDYVGSLYRRGFPEIIIQTNGIRFAEPGYLEQFLPYKDRLGIGFSLHSSTAKTNDDLTTVRAGAFEKKLLAIPRAVELGFRVKITLVLSRLNLEELVPFVELCSQMAGESGTFLQFSVPSFEGRMNLHLDTYPRLSELTEALPPALKRARELKIPVALCHQCQVPPCVIPDDVQHLESLWFCEEPSMWTHDRAYGPQCADCAMRPRCSGIWAGYADNFGTHELKPFAPQEVEPFE